MAKRAGHPERRSAIIEAFARCVARGRGAAVTMRQVADEAGVSVGQVQHYFAGKEDLLLASVAEDAASAAVRIGDEIDRLGPVATERDRVRVTMLGLLPLDEDRRTGARLRILLQASPGLDAVAGIRSMIATREGLLRERLAAAEAAGELRAGVSVEPEARGLASVVTGLTDGLLADLLTSSDAVRAADYHLARTFQRARVGAQHGRSPAVGRDETMGATALRIVRSAERHFAENGIDGASLREILRDAGQSNAGAVQYYFGDRHGLVRAVIVRHRRDEAEHRHELLDAYEKAGVGDLRGLADALVAPMAAKLDDPDGGRAFLRINAEYFMNLTRDEAARNPIPDTSVDRWHALLNRLADADQLADPVKLLAPRALAVRLALVQLSVLASAEPEPEDRLTVSFLVDVVTDVLAARQSRHTADLRRRQVDRPEVWR